MPGLVSTTTWRASARGGGRGDIAAGVQDMIVTAVLLH